MASKNLLLGIFALLALSGFVHSQRDNVECEHQREECVCDSNAKECYFELEVEELQTFTSYFLDRDGAVVTRRTPGDTYFWDRNTLSLAQSLNCPIGSSLPECGRCSRQQFEPFYSYTEQTMNSCSLPMTVDGSTYRLFIAVNGRIPGPTLVVTEGQFVIVKVTNKLTSEGITIHWHGMHQRKTPWMDGVAFVSQPPIVPGAEFTYIFNATPPGTHWYHSHAGAQRTDGLFGALIVRESPENQLMVQTEIGKLLDLENFTLPEQEHTLTFLDWQRESSLSLFVQLHSTLGFYPTQPIGSIPNQASRTFLYSRTRSSDGIEVGPSPFWSGLINGRGRHRNQISNSFEQSKLSIFNVEHSQTYRFRLIGAQSLFAFKFSIDNHKLIVIASDGHFFQPVQDVDFVIVHTGERYDILVVMNQDVNNYWIRAETLETGVSNSAEAILHYNSANNIEGLTLYNSISSNPKTCSEITPCRAVNCPFGEAPGMNCIHLHQLTALFPSGIIPQKVNPQSGLFFNFGFEGSGNTSAINGRNFKPPVTPYQTDPEAYKMDKTNPVRSCAVRQCNDDVSGDECECTYVKEIGGDNFSRENPPAILFVLSAVGSDSRGDFSHPVHLHGHSFSVLDVQHGTYRPDGTLNVTNPNVMCNNELCRSPQWQSSFSPSNYSNANMRILKDTVIVPAGGYVVIAFLADNPGYWFMHCHIESHQLEGMGVIIREYPDEFHTEPPTGINKVGDFSWTVSDYKRITNGSPREASSVHTVQIVIGVVITLLAML